MLKDLVVSTENSYSRSKEFNLATNCVAVLYMLGIQGYSAGAFQKVIIDVTPGAIRKTTVILDVIIVSVDFDLEGFWRVQNKKRLLLELINAVMQKLAADRQWDLVPLQRAYSALKDSDLELFLYIGKRINSPNRKLKCQLGLDYQMDFMSLVLQVFDAKTGLTIQETEIVRTEPHEFSMAPYLGRVKWIGADSVMYESKGGVVRNEIKIKE